MATTTRAGRPALPRAVAVLTVAMTADLALGPATGSLAHAYSLALIGVLCVAAITCSTWLWLTDTAEARLAVGLLAMSVGLGQVLVSVLGGPTGSSPSWTTSEVTVVLAAGLVMGLLGGQLAADMRAQVDAQATAAGPERPYAL